jgi:hypothetical protein
MFFVVDLLHSVQNENSDCKMLGTKKRGFAVNQFI